jgi:hypothetical protein
VWEEWTAEEMVSELAVSTALQLVLERDEVLVM